MTRTVGARAAVPFEDAEFFLEFGPMNQGEPEFTDAEAEAAWRVHGDRIMAGWHWPADRPGFRPWGFWKFTIGEVVEDYEDQILTLASRGLLRDEEVEALARKRTWVDINDGSKHTDPAAVELYERVSKALRQPN